MAQAFITRPTKYKFSHQAGGRYYWRGPGIPGTPTEEVISCSVKWFWNREVVS